MKAWQRQVREDRAANDADADLFGRWWEDVDINIKRATIREVSEPTSRKVIEEYEWLGCLPSVTWFHFGIYFDNHLGGVVVFSPEYGENLGVWDQYEFTGKLILLARGACVHWAHEHAGSKLIASAIRQLPPRYEVVTATVDPAAGEVGTIYQACNFIYVGATGGRRNAMRDPSGKIVYGRTLRRRFGHERVHELAASLSGWTVCPQQPKGRYFYFRGKHKAKHHKAIEHLIVPYPKRI